jgi:hypothetical protein
MPISTVAQRCTQHLAGNQPRPEDNDAGDVSAVNMTAGSQGQEPRSEAMNLEIKQAELKKLA